MPLGSLGEQKLATSGRHTIKKPAVGPEKGTEGEPEDLAGYKK